MDLHKQRDVHNNLPKYWIQTKIKDVCELINGRAFKPSEWASEGLPIIRIQNLNNDNANFNYCNFRVDEKYLVNNGQLLFAWSGTPGTSFGAHIWRRGRAVLNQHIFKVEINEENMDKNFLMHLLNRNVDEYIRKAHGTAGLAHITKGKFENSLIPLPPLPEQHRIVSKIEELFTRLDAGVEALKKIKAQLKRYRQAVLKYAFEGKLTEEWREKHKGEIEPASELLEKIREERLLQGRRKSDNPPIPPLLKGGKKGFVGARNDNLPRLPEGWVWTRVGMISEMIQYGTSEKANEDSSGIPVLRMGNIQDGKLNYEDLKYFPKSWSQLDDFFLKAGDVLFNRTNSAELVGKTAVYKSYYPPSVFASYLIRVKVNKNAYSPDLLASFINSFYGRQYIASVVSQQVGQANVNGTKLSLMPIPLPPLPEQHKIVEEIERRFSVADEGEKTVEQSLKQAERLRQSILKKAFEGKLVPQDPTDEPAENLLERIKIEKEKVILDRSELKRRQKKRNR
ncbi:MAG: restriction endonuclease subunit S [Nitrospirota bacterium]